MADKRTNPTNFDALIFLGLALQLVATWGEVFFEEGGEDELVQSRLALLPWLRAALPGDQFPFWEKEHPPEKSRLEAEALPSALWILVERQRQRVIRSGSILADPLPLFRKLYRQELLKEVSEHRVLPRWRLTEQVPSVRDDEAEAAWPMAKEEALGDVDDWEKVLSRIEDEMLSFARECVSKRGLTPGERSAFVAAMKAIYNKGACCHLRSRRGNSLSHYLSPAQMRQLRRAYRKHGEIKPFLTQLSVWFANVRKKIKEDAPVPEGGGGRRRFGNAYLDAAKEAEEAGRPDVAAGLRAIDKRLWGLGLTEEEFASVRLAKQWVVGEYRQSALDHLPDAETMWKQMLQDGSDAGARRYAHASLRLALLCWPQGVPQAQSPDSPLPD